MKSAYSLALAILSLLALLQGCTPATQSKTERNLQLEDFIGQSSPQMAQRPAEAPTLISSGPPPTTQPAFAPSTSIESDHIAQASTGSLPTTSSESLTLTASTTQPSSTTQPTPAAVPPIIADALVGQVNGKPIYARSILDPLEPQLEPLGSSLPTYAFRERATALITSQLHNLVFDTLILDAAERDLTPQEVGGLDVMMKERREELLRKHGQGSYALADSTLRQTTGKGMEQTLKEARNQVVVQRYLRQVILPKVNITRKDIERYYRDHQDQYNKPASRCVRLIRVDSDINALNIQAQLDSGKDFTAVAGNELNTYQPGSGGLVSENAIGDKVFSQEELNQALLALSPGEYSPRIAIGNAFWWVFLESVESGQNQPLEDVQGEIEARLRHQQFQTLAHRYRLRVLQEGSYNSIDQMIATLTDISVGRFARRNQPTAN